MNSKNIVEISRSENRNELIRKEKNSLSDIVPFKP